VIYLVVFAILFAMKTVVELPQNTPNYSQLTAAQLRLLLTQRDEEIATVQAQKIAELDKVVQQKDRRIQLLEEMLRLARIQRFAAKSEKHVAQLDLFDEAELAVAIDALADQLPDENEDNKQPRPKKRQRGFSEKLERQRIELLLSEQEKAGAQRTFFSKVKEELEFIPAKMTVLEYWQEKAVFVDQSQQPVKETLIAAARPIHPLGKCHASIRLLTHILVSKYADGLPLYRLEGIFKRYQGDVNRSNMAHWIIRLEDGFKPLLNLMREVQNNSDYLQADETRIQVLKEDGRKAQSKSWMWLVRGGPPDKPSVLFTYNTSRGSQVPDQLLGDFAGILQCDGYSGYAPVCKKRGLQRIGCWDHARRKFVEAVKAADTPKIRGKKATPTLAHIALSKIGKLYRIERDIADWPVEKKYEARQQLSVPALTDLKDWLDKHVHTVVKMYSRKMLSAPLLLVAKRGYLPIPQRALRRVPPAIRWWKPPRPTTSTLMLIFIMYWNRWEPLIRWKSGRHCCLGTCHWRKLQKKCSRSATANRSI